MRKDKRGTEQRGAASLGVDGLPSYVQFELGTHPNFNGLFDSTLQDLTNAQEILGETLKVVPEAKAVRSHFMTPSSRLLELFKSVGLTQDCKHLIPAHFGIVLCPYRHWNDRVLMSAHTIVRNALRWFEGGGASRLKNLEARIASREASLGKYPRQKTEG